MATFCFSMMVCSTLAISGKKILRHMFLVKCCIRLANVLDLNVMKMSLKTISSLAPSFFSFCLNIELAIHITLKFFRAH